MTKISVIIPVYNANIYIKKCIQSLLAQTFRDFEIIFINDGSRDDSLKILQSYDFHDISAEIITQENSGQAAARNRGIEKAAGDFLCFVDIDDYIEPTMLEKLNNRQVETGADIVWCDANKISENGKIQRLDEQMIKSHDAKTSFILNNAGPWRKIVKRTIIQENRLLFPMIRFYEDIAVVPAYALYAHHIEYVDEPLYNYVMHKGSTMHQVVYDSRLENIFESMAILRSHFKGMNEEEKACLEFIHIDHLLHAASLRFYQFQEGQSALEKVNHVMQEEFPNWQSNPYFKHRGWKYKVICNLFYNQHRWLLNHLLKY